MLNGFTSRSGIRIKNFGSNEDAQGGFENYFIEIIRVISLEKLVFRITKTKKGLGGSGSYSWYTGSTCSHWSWPVYDNLLIISYF